MVAIDCIVTQISWVFDIQYGGRLPYWIFRSSNFQLSAGGEGQYAASSQISRRSIIPFPRYRSFSIFKMAAVRHLGFLKLRIFNGRWGGQTNLHHLAKYRGDRSNRCGGNNDFSFSIWRPSAIWICCAGYWTTHEGRLMVFITVQNLVRIDEVVSIICTFLAGFWGYICPNDVTHHLKPRMDCPWAEPRHVSHKV